MTSIITTLLLVFAFNHVAESAPKPFGVAERNQLIMNAIQKLLQEEQKQETAELGKILCTTTATKTSYCITI